MTKFVVSVPNAVSAEKVEAIRNQVAKSLGVDESMVVVLVGASLAVIDLPGFHPPDPKPDPIEKFPGFNE